MNELQGKRILVTGGTGSLGQKLVKRILSGELGVPAQITVFSRDEAKQHFMRLEYLHRETATDDVIYENAGDILNFRIGDVRDYSAVAAALRDVDVVFNAAALKQVPACEYYPFEAVLTNVYGPENIVRAIRENELPVEIVVGISTDKAVKPINVMGMTKALQERILIEGNRSCPSTRFSCVRFGNVMASRGSVIPFFVDQIEKGLPIIVTLPEMTRFLLSLDRAVDTVFEAVRDRGRGGTFVSKVASAKVLDIAKVLMGGKDLPIVFSGIRPGEKVHEILISEEERFRTVESGDFFKILPVLPELREESEPFSILSSEYSSKDNNLELESLRELLTSSSTEIKRFMARAS